MSWHDGLNWCWFLGWKSNLNQQQTLSSPQVLLQSKSPNQEFEDSSIWNLSQTKGYSASSLTEAVMTAIGQAVGGDVLVRKIWRNLVPPKVEFMVWLTLLEKLHIKQLLFLKGIMHVQDVLCVFYGRFPEASNHVLLTCQFAWRIWCAVTQLWGF